MTRRDFISTAALSVSAAAAGDRPAASGSGALRLAIVGTGERGALDWGQPITRDFRDVVQIVGLCDINGQRAKAAQALIGTDAPTYTDFDRMIRETRPESVLVTTVDATHWRYSTRAMELGVDVLSEKPLCTDEAQCQTILDTQKKTGRKVTVTFNARHSADAKIAKKLLMEKAIGDVLSVDYHEYLNTAHGADYFRRWHHLKENSGTLLCHKASHHFDLVNWWLDSRPLEVSGFGELKFYGRNHSFRGTHCRSCPFQKDCSFYWDVTRNRDYERLYVDCESEDGYLRDACVWRENTNIYDTMSVRVSYQNGAVLTYTSNTYLPYEGQSVSFNGTKGRLDLQEFGGGGFGRREIRLTRSFGKSEIIREPEVINDGRHNGEDDSIQSMVFRHASDADPLQLRADLKAGALSSLVGIAAYRSIERGGAPVKIADLIRL
ncbi:MAG: Gfo/Idh/MocA family oxidoreductase [Bryobacteraceae bacterium]